MKIGINYKSIKKFVITSITQMGILFSDALNSIQSNVDNHETRITTLEENSASNSEWVEITSSNGLEAEITQEFSEIRMLAKVGLHSNYVVTCNYDSDIFHNTSSNAPTYIICGNPTENNYGCKFKYMKQAITEKQYVCVDSCFEGGSATTSTFRAWIKPANSIQ